MSRDPTDGPWGKLFSGGLMAGERSIMQPDGDMVFKTSHWHRYMWQDHRDASNDAETVALKGDKKIPRWSAWMREAFTRLYADNPQRVEEVQPEDSWAEKAHSLAEELPEFERLRDRCVGNRMWSGMAATALAEQVWETMPVPKEKLEDASQLKRRLKGLQSLKKDGVPVDKEAAKAAADLQAAQDALNKLAQGMDDSAIRQAMRRAIEEANQDINDAENAMSAFGWGDEEGMAGKGLDWDSKRELMTKVRDDDKLKRLAELAGRLKRIAARKQASKANQARDEVKDIVLGDDLARLLPSELCKLSDPETEILFYKDLLERRLLCYELRGSERQGRGPIVVCVDNSASMSGQRELWSKAVALALLDIAKRQKRDFGLIHFDTKVQHKLICDGKESPVDVLTAMEFFSAGGTNFKPALQEALKMLEQSKFNKADIVLVTDGEASNEFAAEYKRQAAAREATTYGISIGGYDGDALTDFADEVVAVTALDGENDATDTLFEI